MFASMVATPEDLFARFAKLGVATTTQHHPPVFTVEESKALRGELPGGHCKNLFLKDKKGALWLVVALEDRIIDMKDLRRRIGAATLSFGTAKLLAEVLGVTPGVVTPFSLINDSERRVTLVLDADMMALDQLNFHPLTNEATTTITSQGLLTFIASIGREARIVAL
jgi:Ala-tRNA(Pro) deacylase